MKQKSDAENWIPAQRLEVNSGIDPSPAEGGLEVNSGIDLPPAEGGLEVNSGIDLPPVEGGLEVNSGIDPPPAEGALEVNSGIDLPPVEGGPRGKDMARTRFIKPGFFMNEELAELPCEARLLFIGLWTIADRAGRLEDRPRKIKAAVFPYEDTDVDTLLGMLAGKQFLKRYRMKGLGYIEISNFVKHQKPHPKEPPSQVPQPEDPEPEDEEEKEESAERGMRNAEWGDDQHGREKPGQSPEKARQSNEAAEPSKEDAGLNIEDAGPSHGSTAPSHGIEWPGSEKIGKGLETERGGHEKRWESQEMDEAGLEMNWEEREMEGQNRVLPALTKDRRIEGEERTYSEGKGCGPRGEARGPRGERRGLEGEGWGPEGEGCGVEASRNEGGSAARLERTAGPDAPADRLQSGSSSVEQAGRRARGVAAVQRKSDVQAVFDYWKDRTRHPDAKLTSEREMKIRGRLEEGYTVEQLQEAVEGCRGSPFHQGDNERGHRYDDITLICRSGSKVEQFVEMAREDRDETRQCGNRSNVRKILQGIELVRSRAAESRDAGDDNKQSQGRMLAAGART